MVVDLASKNTTHERSKGPWLSWDLSTRHTDAMGIGDEEQSPRRNGVDPAAQGLTFPLFGPGGHNFTEKSSG
jgi:hypothetical protein